MIDADDVLRPLQARGFDFYTGVPCSFLTALINRTISDPKLSYVGATSEGEAVGIAAGAWLAGRKPVMMCQNSGLGNAVNPLTSLNYPFRIPLLLIVTWRGQPGIHDEPQHELMGQITQRLLDTIDIPHEPFPVAAEHMGAVLDRAERSMAERSLPYALVMAKDSVADQALDAAAIIAKPGGRADDRRRFGIMPPRIEALRVVQKLVPAQAAVIATTGKCGRELFTLGDRAQQIYLVGSMGCASAVGLGLALNAERPVIVLDGDGAALMKMGNVATIGAYAPRNLVHIVLDNGVHDSTGGQGTVSPGVDFAGVAQSCGYATSTAADSTDEFAGSLERALAAPGPHMLHWRIAEGSLETLGRPTVKPPDIARRLRDFVAGTRA
jgi:phosphonopyruvate decarboxylase